MSHFQVINPAANGSILSLEELREAAGVTGSGSDDYLGRLGVSASTALARRCCIITDGATPPSLLSEDCRETLRWTECGPIRLSRKPVTSILSVTIAGVLTAPASYELSGGYALHYLSGGDLAAWPAGRIVIDYRAGFTTPPGDLKLAATKLVTALNAEKSRDPNLKRENIAGVMEREYWVAPSDDPLLSREIADLLSPYVERWI